jgi:hypothetical protein
MIHPVVLGSGKRLFHDGAPRRALRLIEATTTSSGLATLVYARPDSAASGVQADQGEQA